MGMLAYQSTENLETYKLTYKYTILGRFATLWI